MRAVTRLLCFRFPLARLLCLFFFALFLGTLAYSLSLLHLAGFGVSQGERRSASESGFIQQYFMNLYDSQSNSEYPAQAACVFPRLELNDSEIMQFYKKYPRLQCAPDPDWISIKHGRFVISEEAAKRHPGIHCDAYPIVKVTDFKTRELEPIKDVQNWTVSGNDFYRVSCKSSSASTHANYLAGIRQDKETLSRPKQVPADGLDMDVFMLGFDSTSRLAWLRHLPKSRDYFVNVLNGIEMQGYNIVGDGTPAALMPILLGHREEELHEARRGYPGATTVDDFPWIFHKFKAAGYVTAWAEDQANIGTFQYRMLGFDNQPTDHFYRYFWLASQPHFGEFLKDCQGSRPRHSIPWYYMHQAFQMYRNQRKFMFSFQGQVSHGDNNFLTTVDDDLLEYLQTIHREKLLDNTVFIMMADHGARFSNVRATEQGKQEERLPYFAFRFPEWFHEKYPQIIKNIKTNSQRLTTPFDVHETLLQVLHYTGSGTANISKRGVSMFDEIPLDRNCENAHIDPHWCSCLDWKTENTNSQVISQVVAKVIDTFNNFTASYRDLCAVLGVGKVISAVSRKGKDAVLKFKETNDGGRGRFGAMTDTTLTSRILYQVTLITQPGGGRFEVTIMHDVKRSQFTLEAKDISRTNAYGESPHCVANKKPFLRPFCFCKDLLTEDRAMSQQPGHH